MKSHILALLVLTFIVAISAQSTRNSKGLGEFHRQLQTVDEPKHASQCVRVNIEKYLWSFTGDQNTKEKGFADSDYEFKSKHYREDIQMVYQAGYKPNVEMVVSLCEESVDPILEYAKRLKVKKLFIYSKCSQAFLIEEVVGDIEIYVEELENVGREGHTFLTHMLREDQDRDPNGWTLFLQGRIEKTLDQLMLGIMSAHEHDNAGDGTNFINLYRILDEFCKPLQLGYYFKDTTSIKRWHNERRYQSEGGGNNFLDFMTKDVTFRGEFLLKNSLFVSLNRPKLLDIKSRLEKGNRPVEGHVLERFWIRVLSVNDNCRCDDMPMNEIPLELASGFM